MMTYNTFKGFLAGAGLGVLGTLGTLITMGIVASPIVKEARVFQREEGKPAIIRLYKAGTNGLLVQDLENDGKYIPFSTYLSTIKNPADRKIEKGTIEKVVEWYK